MARINYIIPLIAFLVIALFLAKGLKQDPSKIPSPLIGKPMPIFSSARLLSPALISNHDLQGQVVLLNVWASWCYSCRIEHPVLVAIAQSGKVKLYGLNYKDLRADATHWLQVAGNPYIANIYDPQGKIAINFGVYGTPETFLIDKTGIIRYKYIGPISLETWQDTLLPRVEALEQGVGS